MVLLVIRLKTGHKWQPVRDWPRPGASPASQRLHWRLRGGLGVCQPIVQGNTSTLLRACGRAAKGKWTCCKCKEELSKSEFSLWLATRKGQNRDRNARCNSCRQAVNAKGMWKCVECKEQFPKCEFSSWLASRSNQKKNDGTARCNRCKEKQNQEHKRVARSSWQGVQSVQKRAKN